MDGEPGQVEVQCKEIEGLKWSQDGTLEGTIYGTRKWKVGNTLELLN